MLGQHRKMSNTNGDVGFCDLFQDVWHLPKADPQYDKIYQHQDRIEHTEYFSTRQASFKKDELEATILAQTMDARKKPDFCPQLELIKLPLSLQSTTIDETKTTEASPLKLKLRSHQTSPVNRPIEIQETAFTPLKLKKTERFSSLYTQTAASEIKDVTPSGYYTRNVSPDQNQESNSLSFKQPGGFPNILYRPEMLETDNSFMMATNGFSPVHRKKKEVLITTRRKPTKLMSINEVTRINLNDLQLSSG